MGFHDLERRSTMDRESSTWNNLTVKVRLHCATGCTTGCENVYTLQPVAQPVVQPVVQLVVQPVVQPVVQLVVQPVVRCVNAVRVQLQWTFSFICHYLNKLPCERS